jgi:hypothetical protein
VIVLPPTSDIRQFRSRNCPQYSGTDPNDQGGNRHGGSATWISRTYVFEGCYRSREDLFFSLRFISFYTINTIEREGFREKSS